MTMQRKYAVAACLIAIVLVFIGAAGAEALTFTASDISHTAAITQDETTFLAATSSDSLYAAGVVQFTGSTASATALVIGRDVPLFRNAANQLRVQAGLSVQSATSSDSLYVTGLQQNTGATASATALVLGNDVPLFRSAANRLNVQAGLIANQATSSDSLYVSGVTQLTGATASGTSLVIGNSVPLFASADNRLNVQAGLIARQATSSDSLYVAGLQQNTGATASATALVLGNDAPLFRSAANTLTIQASIALQNGETIGNSTNNVVFINSISTAVATDTATTTPGLWIGKAAGTASTTKLVIGGGDEAGETTIAADGCIQMWSFRTGDTAGQWSRIYINGAGTGIIVESGACND